jgi:phosphoglycolate phosphatase
MHVWFKDASFDADMVAFDKDGTLIDFEFMWGRLAVTWVERLAKHMDLHGLEQDLYASLGYDPQRQRTEPQSPLAIATTAQLQTIAAATLYRHGVPWPEAEDFARIAFGTSQDLPLASLIRPTGDVASLCVALQRAGVRVAVVTTDHRLETEETLRILAISDLVDCVICGDDGLPPKPAADMLLAACEKLAVEPIHCAVVGDTMGDLLMARRAGAGLTVAVLSGAGDPGLLAQHADIVLQSIDEISLTGPKGGRGTS